jgi:hypothetical protein
VDLTAVFLLSLLGGYCFAYVWRVTAFTTRRIEGHHLYFRAALWGTMFFAIALALRLALIRNSRHLRRVQSGLERAHQPTQSAGHCASSGQLLRPAVLRPLINRHEMQVLRPHIIGRRPDDLPIRALFHHVRRPACRTGNHEQRREHRRGHAHQVI